MNRAVCWLWVQRSADPRFPDDPNLMISMPTGADDHEPGQKVMLMNEAGVRITDVATICKRCGVVYVPGETG